MSEDLGCVVFRAVAGEAFWPVHVDVDFEVLVLVLCFTIVELARDKNRAIIQESLHQSINSPLMCRSLAFICPSGMTASTDDVTTTLLTLLDAFAAFKTDSVPSTAGFK